MTNRERLISLLGFQPSKEAVEGELLDRDIDPDEDYVAADSASLKRSAIAIMELLLTTADTTNDVQYSIKYDRGAVLNRIKLLKAELGLTDEGRPIINTISIW